VRTLIKQEHDTLFERFDLLASPTSPTVAFRLGERTQNPLAMYLSDVLTIPSNMAGLPGLSIPCGLSEGLPVGLQLIGPQFSENAALSRRPRPGAGARLRLRPGAAEMSWEAVIGLEIHVQLKTRTKMFCRCAVGALDAPNTRTCPICLAHPGTLPVPNRQAVEWTIRLGLALGCEIAEHAVFHRKHYFYPDNPKGYQISQYDEPLCIDGLVRLAGAGWRRRDRHHARPPRGGRRQDAARRRRRGPDPRSHRFAGRLQPRGTPLVEIVTEPDIRTAEQARRFLQLLRQDGGGAWDLGRGDGEGIAPFRCQRQRPSRRVGRAASRAPS
jgi:hypothetical protein